MLKISIPKPCHQDWNIMTPNEQGRHCNSCAKTVVDFTVMSDEEVKQFFINKKEEKVCGRFCNQQLQRISIELPQNIFYISMPVWKKFLVASLIVFSSTLFSCDTIIQPDTIGKVEVSKELKVIEYNMGKPQTPLPPPMPPPIIKGAVMAYDSSYTTGETILSCPQIEDIKGIIDFPVPDTVLVNPSPPKADSVKCDSQIFY